MAASVSPDFAKATTSSSSHTVLLLNVDNGRRRPQPTELATRRIENLDDQFLAARAPALRYNNVGGSVTSRL